MMNDPFYERRLEMTIRAPDSPFRFTSKGEYRKPAFVKFDPEDDGAYLDEIFWEGEFSIVLFALMAILICPPQTRLPSRHAGAGTDTSRIGGSIQFVCSQCTLREVAD